MLRKKMFLATVLGLLPFGAFAQEAPNRLNPQAMEQIRKAGVEGRLYVAQQIPPSSLPANLPANNPVQRGLPAPGAQQMIPEPIPISQGYAPYAYDMNPPKMPPYAWPTYAPHNNYSRVGYPEAYPANAWPFIGPVYPFPKVPPGWRSVKLEWDDGHWWFSQTSTKHHLWKLRYW